MTLRWRSTSAYAKRSPFYVPKTASEETAQRSPLFLGVYRSNARLIVPEGHFIAFAVMGEHGRVFLGLTSRFEDVTASVFRANYATS